jgi:hypothetical protein
MVRGAGYEGINRAPRHGSAGCPQSELKTGWPTDTLDGSRHNIGTLVVFPHDRYLERLDERLARWLGGSTQ